MVNCVAPWEFFLITFTWCLFSCVSDMCAFTVLKVCQKLTEYGVHFHRVLPEKRSQTGIMLGVFCKGVLIFEVLNGNRTPVLRFPWRETKKISFNVRRCTFALAKWTQRTWVAAPWTFVALQKKKICLQNTSDGIKHLFQTDSNKTCQYLLQLCSDQHKFHQQMKARLNNQELQDLGRYNHVVSKVPPKGFFVLTNSDVTCAT